MALTIGEVARKAGCSVPTIRFYESVGLIPKAARSGNGRRSYGWPDVTRLTFVRRAREFGLSIDQVRQLLAAQADCDPARSIIEEQLEHIRRQQRELAELERSLARMLDRCVTGCSTTGEPCTIIGDIAPSERISPAACPSPPTSA